MSDFPRQNLSQMELGALRWLDHMGGVGVVNYSGHIAKPETGERAPYLGETWCALFMEGMLEPGGHDDERSMKISHRGLIAIGAAPAASDPT